MDELEKKITRAVKPFVPLARDVTPSRNSKLVDYMFKLLKDARAYRSFAQDPAAGLAAQGIAANEVSIPMFVDLAKMLRDRAAGKDNPLGRVANSMTSESNTGYQYNFDHSKSATKDYATSTTTEAGMRSETSTNNAIETNTKFDGVGIKSQDEILRHELKLLFHPSQPLVTPELISVIRKNLGG